MKTNELITKIRGVVHMTAPPARELLEQAADALQQLTVDSGKLTVGRWIPVEERLPEAVDSYLVVVKMKYDHDKEYDIATDVATFNPYELAYIDGCWNTYNDWDEGQQYIHVTHWMPLPEPPKEATT